MSKSISKTTELLSKIYRLENIRPSVAHSPQDPHLLFESIRRFLDITRHIYRRWPYSVPYILAFDQTHLLTQVFEQFPWRARHCSNIAMGAQKLFQESVTLLSNPFFAELLEYEDALNTQIRLSISYTTERPTKDRYLKLPYDLESFYISLLFYGRASAPAFLYQQLIPEPGTTYKLLS